MQEVWNFNDNTTDGYSYLLIFCNAQTNREGEREREWIK